MPRTPRNWNEEGLSETPAVKLLEALGYQYVDAEALDAERQSLREAVLAPRLTQALKKLNPWLSDDNTHKAVRAISHIQATSLLEANEAAHTALTYGIALEQDRGDGRRSHQVQFIDWDNPKNNEFIVTRQYRVKGSTKEIRPDVVRLVNGIPLCVIECKSPTIGDKWRHEAVAQFDGYQELSSKYRGVGSPRLFHTVQINVATCGLAALCGTVFTPERFYLSWKEPFPETIDSLTKKLGKKPNAQEVTFYGLLTPANLLDITRHFVVFERDPNTGRTVRKIPRYQQLIAVNRAIKRSRTGKDRTERGGVVWHTQGSGKSLTMLWLALKLRRDAAHENPTFVLVTDRKSLDDQIIGTFRACGFPNPERAESIRELRDFLSGPSGRTMMTTVQKFQEAGGCADRGKRLSKPKHPVLTTTSNVFVLADEAHRTQYGSLAANLRAAMPNAVFFGFTGTLSDKKDRRNVADLRRLHRRLHHRTSRGRQRHGAHLLRGAPPRAAHPGPIAGQNVRPRFLEPQRRRARGDQEEVRHGAVHRRGSGAHRSHLSRPHRALHALHRAQWLQSPSRVRQPRSGGHLQGDARQPERADIRRGLLRHQQGHRAASRSTTPASTSERSWWSVSRTPMTRCASSWSATCC